MHRGETDANAGERSRPRRRGQAIHLIQAQFVPRQQLLDALEQDVSEAFGRMQRNFFYCLIALGKRNTAELRSGVDGKNHLLS
jgi:hypothetical protein